MQVSIIVPTYNRLDQLRQCVAALKDLDYPSEDHEILIVNDGSSDGTRSFLDAQAETVDNLTVIHQENQGVAAARNTGIERATGEIIFFTDDDCLVPRDWIQQHLQHYEEKDIAGVDGVQWPHEMNYVEAYKLAIYWKEYEEEIVLDDPQSLMGVSTNNLSYKQAVFEEAGQYDERFRRGSDPEHSRRVLEEGYTLLKDSSIRVSHLKKDSLHSYLRGKYRHGKGARVRAEKYGDEHNPRASLSYLMTAWHRYIDMAGYRHAPDFPLLVTLSMGARILGELRGGW